MLFYVLLEEYYFMQVMGILILTSFVQFSNLAWERVRCTSVMKNLMN